MIMDASAHVPKKTQKELDNDRMIARAFNTKPTAQRSPAHFDCLCTCETPAPTAIVDEDGLTLLSCAECGEQINVDTAGQPYRKFPGDLAAAQAKRRALDDMRELVRALPEKEQRRLARLPKDKFAHEAYAAITRFEMKRNRAMNPTVAADTKPNVRRRLQHDVADVVDNSGPVT